jgi:imidazolonepropionase-like amidohydrolase
VVVGERVLTGPAGQVVSPGAVLVQDDTILAVGSPESIERIAGPHVERLAFPGATVLPGLIDCHVHLAFNASADVLGALQGVDDAALFQRMGQQAQQMLEQGITTVRDLGDRNYLAVALRDRIAAGELAGPRILTSGAPLTTPGGHCWFLGGEVADQVQVQNLVRQHADAGVDWIKVMVSGGRITPGCQAWESQFSAEQLVAIVEEAHAAGLPVAAHGHAADSIAIAAEAGVDSIEHCTWQVGPDYGTADPRDHILGQIADKQIAICPTISPGWRILESKVAPGFQASRTELLQSYEKYHIRVIAGTDAGATARAPFDGYLRSLEFFAQADIPLPRILDIATVDAAAALGANAGILGHGRAADLLVVDGNPLVDLAALRAIRLVVAQGRRHTPTTRTNP